MARGPRRQVDIARLVLGTSIPSTSPIKTDLLGGYAIDMGLLEAPPGLTVGPIKYSFALTGLTAQSNLIIITWGIGVFPTNSNPIDLSPQGFQHLDWMEWGRKAVTVPANTTVNLVGNGDQGFRESRAMRKMGNVEDELSFVLVSTSAPAGLAFELATSVVCRLP